MRWWNSVGLAVILCDGELQILGRGVGLTAREWPLTSLR
jgi:hypothetical protein